MEGFSSKPTIEKKEDDMGQTIEKGFGSLGNNMGIEGVEDKIKNLSPEGKKIFFTKIVNGVSEAWKEHQRKNFDKWIDKNWGNLVTKDGVRWDDAIKEGKKSNFLDKNY